MQKHQIQVSQEDIERVDTLRYMWAKLQEQVSMLQTTLLEIQPKFHLKLITNVEQYKMEVELFTDDYRKVLTASVMWQQDKDISGPTNCNHWCPSEHM